MTEELSLPRSLYDASAVEATVEAYNELATFDVKLVDDAIMVTINDPDPDVADIIVDEFCNHALSETIRSKQA